MTRVIDFATNQLIYRDRAIRAIVAYNNGIIELGWCNRYDPNLVVCRVVFENLECNYIRKTEELSKLMLYSNKRGCYIFNNNLTPEQIFEETYTYGRGGFPYNFQREYEAVNCFHIFEGKQSILNEVEYPLSKYLKYSFGAEFETYAGYIPQETCLRDGLIPLRDGSLEGGIEYSTTVLSGNQGLNLLKQQIDTLKKYTYFNKECSLHFHFGGYPVSSKHIWALYIVWKTIEGEISEHIPHYSFRTAEYKNSGKDYCKPLPGFVNFGKLYYYLASQKYFGSLTQNHPADPDKRSKWQIHSRYHNVNLVNMVCYKGPKTVEFRFLRPTFNYHKITLWLYIFNAILMYSERVADSVNEAADVINIIRSNRTNLKEVIISIYPQEISSIILNDLSKLRVVVNNQTSLCDYIGATTNVEDILIDPNTII